MQKLFLHAVSIPPQRLYGRVIIFCGTPRTYTWKLLRSKNCFSDQKQYKPLTRRSNTAIIREESACNNPTFMNVLKIYTCAYSKRYSTGYCRTVSCLFPCFWQNRMQKMQHWQMATKLLVNTLIKKDSFKGFIYYRVCCYDTRSDCFE